MAGRNAGLAEEFLEKRVHGLEAVGVAGIIAQQDIMLQKENVVFPAVEENQPVLAKLVKRDKICATCCPTLRMTPFRADCSSDNRALMTCACWLRSKCSPRLRIHSLPSRIRLAN